MSYLATLNFEGKEFDVVRCECRIERSVDIKGRPSSNLYGGKVFIEVESTNDTTIFEHMATQFKPNRGTITFNKDEANMMKEWKWENGYIINMDEGMANTNGSPMFMSFSVSAQTLIVGGVELKQNWPEAG
jgi:hypothetical protein